MSEIKTISIIGSGNVASWFAFAMKNAGISIRQVYSHSLRNAEKLASRVQAEPISDISELKEGCDLYLFSLKDDVYPDFLKDIRFTLPFAVHTAGSVSQTIFTGIADNFGVLYPYQTISKELDFEKLEVPLCIEANTDNNRTKLQELAMQLSGKLYHIDEKQRFALHLSAVFASNFSNAMYSIAYRILQQENIEWNIILPLLQNTVDKVRTNAPGNVQTGPAIRDDKRVMEKHIAELKSDELRNLYRQISDFIRKNQ